jgi:hypothetical protein
VPVCPLATVVPAAVRSYFTLAVVDEVSVTESTLDDTADARGLEEKELMAEENCEPFWSSATRLLFGVEELKNSFQSAVIAATAELELVALAVDGADDEAGAVVGVDEEELGLLLEQADVAATSTMPSTGAR